MRRNIFVVGMILIALSFLVVGQAGISSTHAKGKNRWSNLDVRGAWASQLTGAVMLPDPLPSSVFNGSYCLTGLVEADGLGNAQGTVYDNYNGLLLQYTWQGTYQVTETGTMTVTTEINLMGTPYRLTMFGVICNDGNQIRLIQISPTMGELGVSTMLGVPDNYLGTTITGSWVRQ